MADAAQVAEVRDNIDDHSTDHWDDDEIGEFIDSEGGVNAASAALWRKKAARFAELVDVSEAGATHAFSQLHRNALEMANQFEEAAIEAGEIVPGGVGGRARVKVIERAIRD